MKNARKIGIALAIIGPLACIGCSLPQIFSITSDVTSSLVYGSLIANELGASQSGSGILELINKLMQLLSGTS